VTWFPGDLANRQVMHTGICSVAVLANLFGIMHGCAIILVLLKGRLFNLTCHCINSFVWPYSLMLMFGAGSVKCQNLNSVTGSTSG